MPDKTRARRVILPTSRAPDEKGLKNTGEYSAYSIPRYAGSSAHLSIFNREDISVDEIWKSHRKFSSLSNFKTFRSSDYIGPSPQRSRRPPFPLDPEIRKEDRQQWHYHSKWLSSYRIVFDWCV